jgi:hypothetical protein
MPWHEVRTTPCRPEGTNAGAESAGMLQVQAKRLPATAVALMHASGCHSVQPSFRRCTCLHHGSAANTTTYTAGCGLTRRSPFGANTLWLLHHASNQKAIYRLQTKSLTDRSQECQMFAQPDKCKGSEVQGVLAECTTPFNIVFYFCTNQSGSVRYRLQTKSLTDRSQESKPAPVTFLTEPYVQEAMKSRTTSGGDRPPNSLWQQPTLQTQVSL